MRRLGLFAALLALLSAPANAFFWRRDKGPDDAEMAARYAAPLPAPDGALSVYHLGHSLVNRDMPAMLAQLAGDGHRYDSQLGWGATLKAHWGDDQIGGFDTENAHDRFRPAKEAVDSGDYDALVMTEMVEIRSAIEYHDSPDYLALWSEAALAARPGTRIYLYETWHQLDDEEGWLNRLDADLSRYWDKEVLRPALADLPEDARIHVIPAGQAMAAFVREVEARGGVGNVKDRTDLFQRNDDGSLDQIHLNDLGNYFVALVHYAVLYHRSPEGLPFELTRADGSPATAPEPETAILMQRIAWEAARSAPLTGVEP